jgi:hypothetical protein
MLWRSPQGIVVSVLSNAAPGVLGFYDGLPPALQQVRQAADTALCNHPPCSHGLPAGPNLHRGHACWDRCGMERAAIFERPSSGAGLAHNTGLRRPGSEQPPQHHCGHIKAGPARRGTRSTVHSGCCTMHMMSASWDVSRLSSRSHVARLTLPVASAVWMPICSMRMHGSRSYHLHSLHRRAPVRRGAA